MKSVTPNPRNRKKHKNSQLEIECRASSSCPKISEPNSKNQQVEEQQNLANAESDWFEGRTRNRIQTRRFDPDESGGIGGLKKLPKTGKIEIDVNDSVKGSER